jgi:hypothetical protein
MILEQTLELACKPRSVAFMWDGLTSQLLSYQRLYFRNVNNPVLRPSVSARRVDRLGASAANGRQIPIHQDDSSRR